MDHLSMMRPDIGSKSPRRIPGTLLGLTPNSPRYSTGASGLGSHMSMWLGPPRIHRMMTDFSREAPGAAAPWAFIRSRSASDSPAPPSMPICKKLRRFSRFSRDGFAIPRTPFAGLGGGLCRPIGHCLYITRPPGSQCLGVRSQELGNQVARDSPDPQAQPPSICAPNNQALHKIRARRSAKTFFENRPKSIVNREFCAMIAASASNWRRLSCYRWPVCFWRKSRRRSSALTVVRLASEQSVAIPSGNWLYCIGEGPVKPKEVLALCREKDVKAVDLRFMDFPGIWQHFTIPANKLDEDVFEDGLGFDGSSIRGWQAINESDMILVPQPETAVLDPFTKLPTINMICNIQDPITREDYSRDPRNVARKAVNYLKSTGIADTCYIGPEAEFFVFDDIRFDQRAHEGYYHIDSIEGEWNRGRVESPNLGYKLRHKEGYFPVPPADQLMDLRNEMMQTMIDCGLDVEAQHHEVATAGQCEIDLKFLELVKMADAMCLYK